MNTNIIFIIVGSVGILWFYFTFMRSSVPKRFMTPLYLFTRRFQVYRIEAENRGGLMLPDSGPGYVEQQGAAITRRWGRVWKLWSGPAAIEASRSRETIYIVRENDPTPLTISLGVKGQYQGAQVDNSTFKDLSNLNQREAAANASIEGSTRDANAAKWMIAVLIAVVGAVVAWIGVFAITFIYGEPPL